MSSTLDRLEAAVDEVPVDVDRGREKVRTRLRRRQRRRRATLAVAVAAMVLVGLSVVRSTTDPDQPVITGPGPTVTPTSTPATGDPSSSVTVRSADGPVFSISPDPSEAIDGQEVTVSGSDFPPFGIVVTIRQCTDPVKLASCDTARTALLDVDEHHRFVARFRLFRDVLVGQWEPCVDCVLRVDWGIAGDVQRPVTVPMTFADQIGAGRRPQMEVEPNPASQTGSYPLGTTLTVSASNLQVGGSYNLDVCPSPLETDAWSLVCDTRTIGTARADSTGRFRAIVRLTDDLLSICAEGAPCALAVDNPDHRPIDETAALVLVPFTVTR